MAFSVGGACRTPARPAGTSTATRRGALLPARNTRDTRGEPPPRRVVTGCPPQPGGSMFTSPDEVATYIRDNDVEFVDVRFCDLPGVMQHFTIPASTFGEDTFSEGLGFDGSSIRGFQAINESDMLLLPDANSAFLDPFRTHKTLNVNFFIHDPITREAYSHYSDLRSTMMTNLTNAGLELERGLHEVGTGGQAEINYKFDTLLRSADSLMLFKYIIKNTAWAHGKTATFMPKPLYG